MGAVDREHPHVFAHQLHQDIDDANPAFWLNTRFGHDVLRGYRWLDPNPPDFWARKARGEKVGRAIPITERVIDEEAAALPRLVFQRFLEHVPVDRIAREAGIAPSTVNYWLRHPGFTGAWTFKRSENLDGRRGRVRRRPLEEQVILWDVFPSIVPREQWERVQQLLDRRREQASYNPGKALYALTGILCCAACGSPLRITGARPGQIRYRCRDRACEGRRSHDTRGWTAQILALALERYADRRLARILAEEYRRVFDAGRETGAIEERVRGLARRRANLEVAIEEAAGAEEVRSLVRRLEEISGELREAKALLSRARPARAVPSVSQIQAHLREVCEELRDYLEESGLDIDRDARPILQDLVAAVDLAPSGESAEIRLVPPLCSTPQRPSGRWVYSS